ncbi:MAG: acetyl-CoA C-acetyltransferase [Anaerolineaceae bacterium]
MTELRDVVIVSACRTAIGNFMGTIGDITPGRLGAVVVREAVRRAGIQPSQIDEVIMGNILPAGMGQGIARQSAIWGGIPDSVPAFTVNKLCGSGMKAAMLATQAIKLGDAETIIAGGVESMSTAPYAIMNARKGLRMGHGQIIDTMIQDALTDVFNNYHMGITAENVASRYGITREEQDKFAVWSQNKAEAAQQAGKFDAEIVPVEIPQKKGDPILFNKDEFIRYGATYESLAKLRPAFKPDGTVTAGNASGINDGASALVLMSRTKAEALGLPILAKIRSYGAAALDPAFMGLGPVEASRTALERAGLIMTDIQLVEANEAFAAQALAVGRELQIPDEILNVNGGAIALGHPVGASGSRIIVTLLHEMIKRNLQFGLATLCIGGGMGTAAILERA